MDPSAPKSTPWIRALPWVALVMGACLLLSGVGAGSTPGSDECMHSTAALKLFELIRLGDWTGFWREFHKPEFYTPLGRLGMGLGYLGGLDFDAPRTATAWAWILTVAFCIPLAKRVAGGGLVGTLASTLCVGMLFGSWLTVSYCRAAFLEGWSALVTILVLGAYLKARDGNSWVWSLTCGLLLGLAILVKATYGLFALGAVGLSGLCDLHQRPEGVRPVAIARNVFLGAFTCLGWWFILPLPMGLDHGALHRATLVEYLTKAGDLDSPGPGFLLMAWAVMACYSLPVFAAQVAGLAWGCKRWSCPATRMCVILGIVGPLAFALYPFRIDRFLIPTLFGGCVLGSTILARFVLRPAPPRERGIRLGALLLLIFGSHSLEAAIGSGDHWGAPFTHRVAPAGGPVGTQALLRQAVAHLNPYVPFLWIGGTGTELPPTLVDWTLYQGQRVPEILFKDRQERAWFWEEPTGADGAPWSREEFQAYAKSFFHVLVLDPPDPRGRPREFEQRYSTWMSTHPAFELLATETGTLDGQAFSVRLYQLSR